jgi:hypothetical protein
MCFARATNVPTAVSGGATVHLAATHVFDVRRVGSHAAWRMAVPLHAGLRNSPTTPEVQSVEFGWPWSMSRRTAWAERDLALILTGMLAGLRGEEFRQADVGDIRTGGVATGGCALAQSTRNVLAAAWPLANNL